MRHLRDVDAPDAGRDTQTVPSPISPQPAPPESNSDFSHPETSPSPIAPSAPDAHDNIAPRETISSSATTAPIISHPAPVATHKTTTTKRRVPTPVAVAGLCAASALGAMIWHSRQPQTVVVNTSSTRNPKTSATPAPKTAPQTGTYALPDFITGAPKPPSKTGKTTIGAATSPTTSGNGASLFPNALPGVQPNTNPLTNPSRNAKTTSPVAQLFERAVAAQRAKRFDEAIATYRQLLQIKPDVNEARVNLALLLLQSKRVDQALSQLRLARKTDPKNAAVAFQIAQISLEQKRPREAVEPLKSVVALAPKNPQGWATLAQTQAVLGRRDEAIAAWKRVAQLLPDDVRAPLAIASLAGEQNRLGEAEKWARTAVRIGRKGAPRDPRATYVLGRVLASRQKLRDAETVLRDGLKQFPEALELGTALSDVRWSRGDKSGAIATLQSLLPRVPASRNGGVARAQLLSQIARAQAANKQPKAAAQTWKIASETLPKNAELRSLWGESLLQSGDRSGGIAQLRSALSLDPKRVELRWPLARALAASGDWKAADIEYSKMRSANPKADRNPDLLSEHAQVQERAKQPQDALATWRKIAAVAPRSPLPLVQQARLLRVQKRDDEALRALNRALELKPNEPNALLGAAQIENKKNPQRALKLWTTLAQTRPDFAPAYGNAMSLSVAQRQSVATANALKAPLRRQTENRAAFGAVLRGLLDANEIEAAQKYIKDFRDDYPKAKAPQWAEAALDVELKKRELAAAEARSRAGTKSSATPFKPSLTPPKPDTSSTRSADATRENQNNTTAPRPRWTPKPLSTPTASETTTSPTN